MALAITQPNDSNYLHIYAGVPNAIVWTGAATGTKTYFVSVDADNSDWTEQTTQMGSIDLVNHTIPWTPSATLLGTANEVTTAKFRIVTTGGDDDGNHESDVFTLRRIPTTAIRPNADNISAIYKNDWVNIVWSELYDSAIALVKLEVYDGQSWSDIAASTANDGSYPWRPSDNGITTLSSCKIRISAIDTSPVNNTAMTVEGTAFLVTEDNVTIDPPDGLFYDPDIPTEDGTTLAWSWKDAPNRFEHAAEMAGEKATYMDTAVVLGQLEAGFGVQITQRYKTGQTMSYQGGETIPDRTDSLTVADLGFVMRVDGATEHIYVESTTLGTTKSSLPSQYASMTSAGYKGVNIKDGTVTFRVIGNQYDLNKLAYNVVFKVEQDARQPREFEGFKDMSTVGAGAVLLDDTLYYGKVHKWELIYPSINGDLIKLGDTTDIHYSPGQNNASFLFEAHQVVSISNNAAPTDDIKLWYRIPSGVYDRIELYCVVIDDTTLGAPSNKPTTATYNFRYRWKEIIPQT